MSMRMAHCRNGPFDFILSLSKDEVAALRLLKSPILRQAQDEDFGATLAQMISKQCAR
jgi:hypothetical protein